MDIFLAGSLSPDALNGNSFFWRHLYLLPYTCVLGLAACQVTSKRLGIRSAERWSDVKQLKEQKQSKFGGRSLEKRATLFTSAKLRETLGDDLGVFHMCP